MQHHRYAGKPLLDRFRVVEAEHPMFHSQRATERLERDGVSPRDDRVQAHRDGSARGGLAHVSVGAIKQELRLHARKILRPRPA